MCFLDRVGSTWIQSTHWLPFLILRHCGVSLCEDEQVTE
jgi:hypothetical protein